MFRVKFLLNHKKILRGIHISNQALSNQALTKVAQLTIITPDNGNIISAAKFAAGVSLKVATVALAVFESVLRAFLLVSAAPLQLIAPKTFSNFARQTLSAVHTILDATMAITQIRAEEEDTSPATTHTATPNTIREYLHEAFTWTKDTQLVKVASRLKKDPALAATVIAGAISCIALYYYSDKILGLFKSSEPTSPIINPNASKTLQDTHNNTIRTLHIISSDGIDPSKALNSNTPAILKLLPLPQKFSTSFCKPRWSNQSTLATKEFKKLNSRHLVRYRKLLERMQQPQLNTSSTAPFTNTSNTNSSAVTAFNTSSKTVLNNTSTIVQTTDQSSQLGIIFALAATAIFTGLLIYYKIHRAATISPGKTSHTNHPSKLNTTSKPTVRTSHKRTRLQLCPIAHLTPDKTNRFSLWPSPPEKTKTQTNGASAIKGYHQRQQTLWSQTDSKTALHNNRDSSSRPLSPSPTPSPYLPLSSTSQLYPSTQQTTPSHKPRSISTHTPDLSDLPSPPKNSRGPYSPITLVNDNSPPHSSPSTTGNTTTYWAAKIRTSSHPFWKRHPGQNSLPTTHTSYSQLSSTSKAPKGRKGRRLFTFVPKCLIAKKVTTKKERRIQQNEII